MEIWLIPLLVVLAVLLAARALLLKLQHTRLQKAALQVAFQHQDAGHAEQSWLVKFRAELLRQLPAAGAWQSAWIPSDWNAKTQKKLALVEKWAGHSAAEWWVVKEFSLFAGLLFGALLGWGWLWLAGCGLAAFFLPDLWLDEQVRRRRHGLLRELPDGLDVMTACMEAGLSLDQSVQVILERGQRGYLYATLRAVAHHVRMGFSRQDAWQKIADQLEAAEFSSLVSALIQAERLGVPLARTLRSQAEQLREKRSQWVEKQALEAPVKLLFPLVVFIFPVVFLILFGPILIRVMAGF